MGRHYNRYRGIEKLLREKCSFEQPKSGARLAICDIGCGSAYGTNILRTAFPEFHVYGVEPCDQAREYAIIAYPEVEVYNDIPDQFVQPHVVVMVESIEHMTRTELKVYITGTQVVALTTPLIKYPNNEYHEVSFKTKEDVRKHLAWAKFEPICELIEKGVTFTTGEKGDQYIALYHQIEEDGGK